MHPWYANEEHSRSCSYTYKLQPITSLPSNVKPYELLIQFPSLVSTDFRDKETNENKTIKKNKNQPKIKLCTKRKQLIDSN